MVKERAHEILELEVLAMRRRHLPAVLRIEGKVYPRPWSAGLFLSELAQKGSRAYFVARHQGRVVGYAGVMILGDEGHITNIAVDPAFHRHKVGTRLMISLVEASRDRGARSMTLEVRRANAGAQTMYRNFGFTTVGVRRGYYVETGEDAYIMWAEGVWSDDYVRRLDDIRASLETGRAQD
jgi:[ribosomal protein S18]-alanine N-acetyltransferase